MGGVRVPPSNPTDQPQLLTGVGPDRTSLVTGEAVAPGEHLARKRNLNLNQVFTSNSQVYRKCQGKKNRRESLSESRMWDLDSSADADIPTSHGRKKRRVDEEMILDGKTNYQPHKQHPRVSLTPGSRRGLSKGWVLVREQGLRLMRGSRWWLCGKRP